MAGLGGIGGDLDRWLEPFLAALGHKKRRLWAPLYLRGLLGPSERKSLQPMATSLGLSGHDQLQHFIASPAWDVARHEGWPVVLPHPGMLPRHLSLPHQHAPGASSPGARCRITRRRRLGRRRTENQAVGHRSAPYLHAAL